MPQMPMSGIHHPIRKVRKRGAAVSEQASKTKELPALIPVPVAAALLGLKRASAYRYAKNGELPVKRLGGRVYIITAEIRPLIEGTERNAA
jgi:predicted DNA-binding transcriptional regulator AlpA